MAIRRFIHKRRWFLLGSLLVVTVLTGIIVPAAQRAREAVQRLDSA